LEGGGEVMGGEWGKKCFPEGNSSGANMIREGRKGENQTCMCLLDGQGGWG